MARGRHRHSEFRKSTRCPICAQPCCLVCGPRGSPVAAVCNRVESPKPVGNVGFLHLLDPRSPTCQFTPWGRELARMAREAARS